MVRNDCCLFLLLLLGDVRNLGSLNFLQDNNIDITYPESPSQPAGSRWSPLGEEIVTNALSVLADESKYPLLVCCTHGKHLTGTVIGCLRKMQRWNLAPIFEEYRRYAGHKVRLQNEQFIELFDVDLVSITERSPEFLRRAS
jgi:tyrosine-protein phosphatase OCA1